MTAVTSSTTTPTYTRDEWQKKYHDRLEVIKKLESYERDTPGYIDFALTEKFEEGLPVPGKIMLDNAFTNQNLNSYKIYLNMTNDLTTVGDNIALGLMKSRSRVASDTLFLMELSKNIPVMNPVYLLSHLVVRMPTSSWSEEVSKYWVVVNSFKNAYSLTADELLAGLTYEQLEVYKSKNAEQIGITAEKVESLKAKLRPASVVDDPLVDAPRSKKKHNCTIV